VVLGEEQVAELVAIMIAHGLEEKEEVVHQEERVVVMEVVTEQDLYKEVLESEEVEHQI